MWTIRNAVARLGAVAVAVSAAGLVAGCGDSGTSPSETGAVQAYMQDQPSSGSQAAAYPVARSHEPASSGQAGGSYSGRLDADAQVAISADGHTWVQLGPPSSASVQLQATGQGVDLHGEVTVPVGTYTRVRLVLSGARATLNAGSSIGGISLGAAVDMTVGADGSVVIEKEVPPFEIRADARTRIYWDLRSHLWVNEDNVEEEEVEEEEVQEAAEPRTERDPDEHAT
jgi:hypothetical protein